MSDRKGENSSSESSVQHDGRSGSADGTSTVQAPHKGNARDAARLRCRMNYVEGFYGAEIPELETLVETSDRDEALKKSVEALFVDRPGQHSSGSSTHSTPTESEAPNDGIHASERDAQAADPSPSSSAPSTSVASVQTTLPATDDTSQAGVRRGKADFARGDEGQGGKGPGTSGSG